MKEEIREEQVIVRRKKVYIATDGTEFAEYYKCKVYEWEKFKKPLLDKLQRSESASCNPNFDGRENYESHNYEWYFIRNQEDVRALCDVYEIELVGPYDIGHWVCIEEDTDGGAWATRLDDGINYASEILRRLGYKMTVEKEENNETA